MIRLQDIADMAGVSRTTVSNVINGNTKRVSQSTIDRITAILKEQNYVPHMGSVMLSGHGSRIIGVVLGFSFIHGMQSLQDSFVGEITGTLQVEAENRGYYIMLIGGERIDNVVDMASRWNVEGLIIIGYNEEQYHQLSRKLNKKMVLIDAYPKGGYSFQNVGVDDYSGGYQIGEYLHSKLTTIHQDVHQKAVLALRKLLLMAEGKEPAEKNVKSPVWLVKRDSVKE